MWTKTHEAQGGLSFTGYSDILLGPRQRNRTDVSSGTWEGELRNEGKGHLLLQALFLAVFRGQNLTI